MPIVGYLLLTSIGSIRSRLLHASVVMGVFALVLAPWAYRNTKLHDTFTVVDVMGGRNVMMGNYEFTPLERSWATITDVQGEQAWHRVLLKANPDKRGLTQGQIDKLAMKYGIQYFFAHPTLTAQRCIVRFFNFWQLERTIVAGAKQDLWGPVPKWALLGLAVLILGSYAAVLFLALIGLFSRVIPWKTHGLLLLWMALPCAVHTIAFAHSRYHLPLIPVLSIYAAITLTLWFISVDGRSQLRRAWVPGSILFALFVMSWVREIVMVDLAQMGGGL